jgi:hypothetical protein
MSSIAITGASGLVGSELARQLTGDGHIVRSISRPPGSAGPDTIVWTPSSGLADPQQLNGLNAVVHLAGENIAAGRWTKAVKERLRSSRVDGTRSLVRSLATATARPPVLICASAVGYYGDRGDETLTEASPRGTGFLAELCEEWEHAALEAAELGVRVVCLRIGVVLSSKGGAVAKMLLPFKLGVGGIIGNGRQYMSWIGLTDLARVIRFCLEQPLSGVVNAVSPQPATNHEFTKTLGKALHRPTIFPMPAFAARLAFGEMANELLLASQRVTPERLLASGFQFSTPTLAGCFAQEL